MKLKEGEKYCISGTGKTTTLVRYTQLRPDKKFLLVVYNK
jgi:F-box protein 18 (helicase)